MLLFFGAATNVKTKHFIAASQQQPAVDDISEFNSSGEIEIGGK